MKIDPKALAEKILTSSQLKMLVSGGTYIKNGRVNVDVVKAVLGLDTGKLASRVKIHARDLPVAGDTARQMILSGPVAGNTANQLLYNINNWTVRVNRRAALRSLRSRLHARDNNPTGLSKFLKDWLAAGKPGEIDWMVADPAGGKKSSLLLLAGNVVKSNNESTGGFVQWVRDTPDALRKAVERQRAEIRSEFKNNPAARAAAYRKFNADQSVNKRLNLVSSPINSWNFEGGYQFYPINSKFGPSGGARLTNPAAAYHELAHIASRPGPEYWTAALDNEWATGFRPELPVNYRAPYNLSDHREFIAQARMAKALMHNLFKSNADTWPQLLRRAERFKILENGAPGPNFKYIEDLNRATDNAIGLDQLIRRYAQLVDMKAPKEYIKAFEEMYKTASEV